MNSVISTKTFAISGENYKVLDTYTGDGSTVEFTTSVREDFNVDSTASEIYVTIDGVPTTAFASSVSSGSSFSNSITITFTSAPAAGEFIQVAGFQKSSSSASRSYASIRAEEIVYDGSTTHTLSYPSGSVGPFSGLTMVEVNGKILRGPDNTYYVGDGSTYTYGVASGLGDDSTVDPAKTITTADQVEVYVNGTKKTLTTHYTVDTGNQNVEFVSGSVPSSTDVICISTLVNKHYTIDSSNRLVLDTSQISTDGYTLNTNDVMTVTTFNNALGMKQRREVLEGRPGGVFKLRFDPLNASYMYVWLNGEQLTQNFDYTLSGNTITVVGKSITTSDRLDVMYFALDKAVRATGYRVFKDMMNRTFYKRISKTHTTELTQTLATDATDIKVADATKLANPQPVIGLDGSTVSTIIPGVVFVDKERIEYFTKTNNRLGQLKRGTLGTGIKEHGSGTEVVDASGTQTIPYVDTVHTDTFTGDGSTATFTATKTLTATLNQSSPAIGIPADQIDIFIGGQRLLMVSEDGSTINYSISGDNVTFTSAPAFGIQIKILHKKGQVWYTAKDGNPADGKGLQASSTQQAKFIANEPTNAPE